MILNFSQYSVAEIVENNKEDLSFFPQIQTFLEDWQRNAIFEVQSSGSTGMPKKIQFPKEAFIQSATMTENFLQLQKGNSALLCLPMQYIAAKMMLVRAIVSQLELHCTEPQLVINIDSPFDFVAMTPMQAEKSIHHLHYVQKLILGGMPVSATLEHKLQQIPIQVFETFGMTETLSHIAMRNISNKEKYFTALHNVQISLSENETLCVTVPFLEAPITTNDVVELIDNNRFIWKGRIDTVINSGGIKLFPEEIEHKLKLFISEEFYITSQKDNLLGEKVILCVETENDTQNWDEIFQKAELTSYQIPKKVILKSVFSRTESGKIIREKK